MKYTYFFACLFLTGLVCGSDAKLPPVALPKTTWNYIKMLCDGKTPRKDGLYGHVDLQKVIKILFQNQYSAENIAKILLACQPASGGPMTKWKSKLDAYLVEQGLIREVTLKERINAPNEVLLECNKKDAIPKTIEDVEMAFWHWSAQAKAPLHHSKIERLSIFCANPRVFKKGNVVSAKRSEVTSPVIDPSTDIAWRPTDISWLGTPNVLKE